ncbi:alpha/beta hydrolase [Glycomyces salinus]|uniref:alpha/beta hydrolase n=1 Tax=Glycomyces salinus TaxID=980294 RepID=UPI0018EA5721|nr:alpha/beta hydrolase [Glycomyces salinus]
MSELNWEDLRDTDFCVMKTLAERMDTYIAGMVEQAEVLTEDVASKHLSTDHYEGDTADAVRDQVGYVADSFQDDLSIYVNVKIKATLEDAHKELAAAQQDLEELLGNIEAGKFAITGPADDHRVELSEDLLYDISELNPPSLLLSRTRFTEADLNADTGRHLVATELNHAAEDLADAFGQALTAIMTRAHEAESEAVSVLKSILDEPAAQPPPLGATYDDLIDDYQEAADDRNVDFLNELTSGDSEATPNGVNEWWNDLDQDERDALLEEYPGLLGPLDGLPAEVRNDANHVNLHNEIDSIEQQLAEMDATLDEYPYGGSFDEQEYLSLQNQLENLNSLQDRLETGEENGEDLYLLDFDSAVDGQAVVSVGNPDTADHTAVYVPGTTSDLEGIGGLVDDAAVIQGDDNDWGPAGEETAVVMWLGYDASDSAYPTHNDKINPEAWSASYAEDAREDLYNFVEGIDASHEGESHTTLMGHSCGSSVVGATARDYQVAADQIVDFGNPGLMVDTADSLSGGADSVWSTRADGDAITTAAGLSYPLGIDPVAPEFGGQTFDSEAIGDGGCSIHSGYLKDDKGADPNIAREHMVDIITGQKQ